MTDPRHARSRTSKVLKLVLPILQFTKPAFDIEMLPTYCHR